MKPIPTRRLSGLPPYLFVRLNALKAKAQASGLDVIDLGMGSPDLPSPPHVVEAARRAVGEPWTHRYPPANGTARCRKAIAQWYKRRFDVSLDPETEVLPLIGSKEGVGHLFGAFLEPGDVALVPCPFYPVYYNGTLLAGGKPHLMPLLEKNGYLPDLGKVPAAAARKAKLLLLNYPNNPTAAVLPDDSPLREALAFSKRHGALVAYDNAYSEIVFDGYRSPSILQLPGAKDRAVEFHSLSKTFAMAGWRLGFVVGNAAAVGALAKYKSFLDYGVPAFLQEAAVAALEGPEDFVVRSCAEYQRRRDAFLEAASEAGLPVQRPRASMYCWVPLPDKARTLGSLAFAERLILERGVVVSPGAGFGPHGEGYFRVSLIAPEERMREAARRIGLLLGSLGGNPRKPAACAAPS